MSLRMGSSRLLKISPTLKKKNRLFFDRLFIGFSTLEAQSGLQPEASPSDRVKNSDGADDSPNPMATTFGFAWGRGFFGKVGDPYWSNEPLTSPPRGAPWDPVT